MFCKKKAIRAVHRVPFNSHTSELFKQDKILILRDLYKLDICSHIFYYLNNSFNNISTRLFSHSSNHQYNTRNSNELATPQLRLTTSQSSFLFRGITEWNNIPEVIKECDSIDKFKIKLKDFYCSLY